MSRKYHFIVNSKAKTGKGVSNWSEIENALKEKKIEYEAYLTEYAGHAKVLAKELSNEFADKSEELNLIIVGGDGTVNEVINGISDFSKVKFGYIPIGSANDLAKGLGFHGILPLDALERILSEKYSFSMDLGRTTDSNGVQTYFAISSGIGIDAEVCKAALDSKLKKFLNAIHLGGLTYKLLTLHKLLTMPHVKAKVTLDDGDTVEVLKGIFVVGMNQPYEGGGVPMNPKANSMDGELSMCCVNGYSRFRAFFVLPSLLAAKHEGKKGFWLENFKKAYIELEKPLVLHADGEYLGDHDKITLECIPGEMKFL